MAIQGITGINHGLQKIISPSDGANQIKKIDFGQMLEKAISEVSGAEKSAQAYDTMIATGEIENLHEAMIASQKADITLNFALKVRKSVLDAYQELMRLQI